MGEGNPVVERESGACVDADAFCRGAGAVVWDVLTTWMPFVGLVLASPFVLAMTAG